MTFEFSRDYDKIRAFLVEPRCWRRMVNDAAPKPEHFTVQYQPGLLHVLAMEGALLVSVFLLKWKDGYIEVHFCIAPYAWGEAKRIVMEFLRWIWKETEIERMIAMVPSYNRLALKLAESVGFQGCNGLEDPLLFGQTVRRRGIDYEVLPFAIMRPMYATA